MERRPLKLALIGAGRWGQQYIKTVAEIPDVEIVTIVSRQPELRGLLGSRHKILADWQEAVDDPHVDAVVIATPPHLHIEMATRALHAGKPVLVEKPLALNYAEAKKLLDLSQSLGVPVLVDHVHLFAPAFIALKARIDKIGQIKKIVSRAGNRGPFRPDTPMLWDWGPHDLSMCLDLLGEYPTSIAAERLAQERAGELLGEHVGIHLVFASGVKAEIEIGNILPSKVRCFEVHGNNGSYIYNDLAVDKFVYMSSEGVKEPIEISHEMPLTRVIQAFADVVRNHHVTHPSLKLGTLVVRALASCQQSLEIQKVAP